jgi:hypothetical protein
MILMRDIYDLPMDAGVVVTAVAALLGVLLGGQLSDRSQRRLLKDSRDSETARELTSVRRVAFSNMLAAQRVLRRAVQSEDIEFELVSPPDGQTVPRVKGGSLMRQWEAYETAYSALRIVTGDQELLDAAGALIDAIYAVMRARVDHPPAGVPAHIVDAARDAEQRFAEVSRRLVGSY